MGSFDDTGACELMGLFILNELAFLKKIVRVKMSIVLYEYNFKKLGFNITVEIGLKTVEYLDVKFIL